MPALNFSFFKELKSYPLLVEMVLEYGIKSLSEQEVMGLNFSNLHIYCRRYI